MIWKDTSVDETWRALAHEAGLTAEHIAFGVTILGRANYAQSGYYAQAFFSLSIGIERSAKLAMLIDYELDNVGPFPSCRSLKQYGHDLTKLLSVMENISQKRSFSVACPATPRREVAVWPGRSCCWRGRCWRLRGRDGLVFPRVV